MGSLSFLEPLVQIFTVFDAVSAAFSGLLSLTALSAFLAPAVVLFLVSPIQRGLWRWPGLWWAPSLVSALVLGTMLAGDRSSISLPALGLLGTWLFVTTLTGLVRLAFRLLRFVVSGHGGASSSRFDKSVGVLGLCASAGALLVSVASGSASVSGLSALVALLALLLLRPRPSPAGDPVPGLARLAWVLGTGLIALCAPPFGLCVGMLLSGAPLVSGQGVSRGLVLLVFSALGLLVGWGLSRAAGRRRAQVALPMAPSLEPS